MSMRTIVAKSPLSELLKNEYTVQGDNAPINMSLLEYLQLIVKNNHQINSLATASILHYAINYLSSTKDDHQRRFYPELDLKVVRDFFKAFARYRKRSNPSVVVSEFLSQQQAQLLENQDYQIDCPNGEFFCNIYDKAAQTYELACQMHISVNLVKALKRVIAHKIVSSAPSLIIRFDASRLVSVLMGCIGRCKFLDYQNYVALHACLKKAAAQSSNDFGQLNNLMKPYIKIARLIKKELESKDGINFDFESVLSNVKRFKSFWFVFLPLFYQCCDYLNQSGCKSFVLLPVVSNKLSLVSITELGLRQSVMHNKSFADIFKDIPKYSKAELFGIRTDGYQVQYIYQCNDDFQARTIEEARCVEAVPTPAAGDNHPQVEEDGVLEDLAVLNYVFDLYEDDDGEDVLVVQGHNRDQQQAIEQVEALAWVNDMNLEQLDLEDFQLLQRKRSCQSIVYEIPGQKVEYHGKKELAVDAGIRNYVAVCRPRDNYQDLDCSQIPINKYHHFVLSQSQYLQMVGGEQFQAEYREFSLQARQFSKAFQTVDLCKLRMELQKYFGQFAARLVFYSDLALLKLSLDQYLYQQDALLLMVQKALNEEKLNPERREEFLVYYGSFISGQLGVNGRYALKRYAQLLNVYARVIIMPELMTSTVCYECVRKGVETFVVRNKDAAYCPICQKVYHADVLGSVDIFFLARFIITHEGHVHPAFIPRKFIPVVQQPLN
ncbi:hypothetical protein MP228_004392 [Amoeboaphelidium protococcarum]|nr:hypothetical protein MP228_004392 [Amoeboaphelidium protococcarum]